jgi:hypothetical protein
VQVTSAVADFSAPAVLGPGDKFHWVFVTSTTTTGEPLSIEYYDEFVNDAADAVAGTTDVLNVVGITELGQIDWKAIASTKDPWVTAKDHIGDPTSPIYRFDGALVANDEGDLFDGTIANAIDLTETGTTYDMWVWTGSWDDGSAWNALGIYGAFRGIGLTSATDSRWITLGGTDNTAYSHSLYAISPELTVVPLPGAVLLGILGLSVAGVKLRRFA